MPLDTRLGNLSRTGPYVQSLGQFNTLTELTSGHPANNYLPGTMAYCVDAGQMISDGSQWLNLGTTIPGEVELKVATYAKARQVSGVTTGDILYVLGRTSQSDGGQGLFTWVAGGSTTIDDGFELAAPGGIWRRADTSFVTYEMFGAVPMTSLADVSHDSTAAINACHLALPPPSATTKRPFRVLLQGLYGISSTINFLELLGIEFFGIANFAERGCGYIWIGALSNTTHSLYFRGNRYLKMRRLRIAANSDTATGANAQKSAICLADDYTSSIQERCVFEDIIIGNRDQYDGLGVTNYQFINGFTTETITGQFGNNDFHLFQSVRQQNVVVGWNNQGSQSVGWVLRNCKVLQSDTFLSCKRGSIICYDIEADGMRAAVFILGQVITDSPFVRVHGLLTQTNFAELATMVGIATLTITDADFDQNCNPANIAIVNPAHPYLIVAADNETKNVTLEQFYIGAIPPVIDFGNVSAIRFLTLKGGRPNTIAIHNYATQPQEQRIVFHWEPGGTGFHYSLAANDWAPVDQLIYAPYSTVPDPLLTELSFPTVRMGRRNVSACVDIINVATTVSTVPAGATYTFTNALPVGLILGVSLHISTVPPGPTSIQIGDGTTAARWGTKTNARNNAQPPEASLIANYTDAGPVYNKTVGNVVLTAVGGAFTGAAGFNDLTLTVSYIDFAQRYYNPDQPG